MDPALVGGILSGAGSLFGGGGGGPGKYRPWDVNSLFGNVNFTRDGDVNSVTGVRNTNGSTIDVTPTGVGANIMNLFQQGMGQYLGGMSPTSGFQRFGLGLGTGAVPGAYQGALQASQVSPEFLNLFQNGMGNVIGNLGGLQNTYANLGQAAFGERPQSYDQVAAQRLGLLRDQAQPFENRAFNQLNQNLFDTGRMGSSGGALQTEAFARGLAQADTSRQLDAQSFAEGLYGRDQQAALARNGMGVDLMGMAGNTSGVLGGLMNQLYGAQTGFMDMTNARAQQRLQNTLGLFGLGNSLNQQDINTGLGFFGGLGDLNNQIMQGVNAGHASGQAAQGLQSAPGPSPVSGFLQGIGAGLMNSGASNWGSLFGGSGFNPQAMTQYINQNWQAAMPPMVY